MPARSPLAEPASLDDLLLYRLSRLFGTAGAMVLRLCEGRFGITRREWRVLALLAEEDGLLSSQLAQRAQLDRARTSRAVSSLVAKGLLHREPGQSDRRQARLVLTDAGRAVHAAMFPLVCDINRELLSVLPAQQVEWLHEALLALQAQAQRMVAQAELPKANRRRGGRAR